MSGTTIWIVEKIIARIYIVIGMVILIAGTIWIIAANEANGSLIGGLGSYILLLFPGFQIIWKGIKSRTREAWGGLFFGVVYIGVITWIFSVFGFFSALSNVLR